jgi:cytochrome P450
MQHANPVKPRAVPGPHGYPLVGVLPKILKNPLEFLAQSMLDYREVMRLDLGLASVYLVNHPDLIEQVLKNQHQGYEKGSMWEPIKRLIGEGLPVAEGDQWLKQRRLMQPAFHQQRLVQMVDTMNAAVSEGTQHWAKLAETGEQIDILEEMLRIGLNLILKTMFTTSITKEEADLVGEKFTLIARLVMYRMWTFFLPVSLPRPGDKRFQEGVNALDEVVYRIIQRRRDSGENTGDLLSMLMFSQDQDTGEFMTNKQLRDELITVMTAGHETVAIALGWTWYLLSQNADVEARLYKEVSSVLNGRPAATMQDLPKMPYAKMVLEEAMRLYPPVWPIPRVAVKNDQLGAYHIPAGSMVVVSPYVVHRNPDFWPNPEKFDPERFTPDLVANRPRYAYLPFGGGQRICIGNNFAMMQAQLALAMLVQQYQFKLRPGHPVVPAASATTKPRYGLPMIITKRI